MKRPKSNRGKAHNEMLDVLFSNVEKPVPGEVLFEASGNQVNYQRRIRELRSDDWKIDYKAGGEDGKGWYTLHPPFPNGEVSARIGSALRMKVLVRDGFTCQLCGANRESNSQVELNVDHRIPFEISKNNHLDNLQVLCRDCNLGKKAQCRDCIDKDCRNCVLAFPVRNNK